MREIKFRIRLKNRHDGKEIILYNSIFDAMIGVAFYEIDRNVWELILFEQYTGLKDKNGKEIYEGDIIYNTSWWWGAGEVFLNTGKCGPCDGDNVMTYACRNSKEVFYNIWNGKDVEVIGNIYENQELLK